AGSVGILSAIFQEFYAPRRTAAAYRHLLSLLAGIPSVVFGFWGLVVLAPIIGRIHPPGPSLLAAVLVLALMVLPTVALLAETSLGAVPREQLLGASALGLSRWSVATHVALPAARRGIVAALVLGAGRAVGETMAVLMVSGNVVQWPSSVFDPVRTLTANIALEMSYALGTHRSALFVSGLALTVMVMILVGGAEVVARAPNHAVERGA
ncbi:MAG TPA: ABC transporter permease subunit, partial [Gemmatimonadales bacterium]|nr:ABC transporter permease subunit [Gemmatimonadales bacterium]